MATAKTVTNPVPPSVDAPPDQSQLVKQWQTDILSQISDISSNKNNDFSATGTTHDTAPERNGNTNGDSTQQRLSLEPSSTVTSPTLKPPPPAIIANAVVNVAAATATAKAAVAASAATAAAVLALPTVQRQAAHNTGGTTNNTGSPSANVHSLTNTMAGSVLSPSLSKDSKAGGEQPQGHGSKVFARPPQRPESQTDKDAKHDLQVPSDNISDSKSPPQSDGRPISMAAHRHERSNHHSSPHLDTNILNPPHGSFYGGSADQGSTLPSAYSPAATNQQSAHQMPWYGHSFSNLLIDPVQAQQYYGASRVASTSEAATTGPGTPSTTQQPAPSGLTRSYSNERNSPPDTVHIKPLQERQRYNTNESVLSLTHAQTGPSGGDLTSKSTPVSLKQWEAHSRGSTGPSVHWTPGVKIAYSFNDPQQQQQQDQYHQFSLPPSSDHGTSAEEERHQHRPPLPNAFHSDSQVPSSVVTGEASRWGVDSYIQHPSSVPVPSYAYHFNNPPTHQPSLDTWAAVTGYDAHMRSASPIPQSYSLEPHGYHYGATHGSQDTSASSYRTAFPSTYDAHNGTDRTLHQPPSGQTFEAWRAAYDSWRRADDGSRGAPPSSHNPMNNEANAGGSSSNSHSGPPSEVGAEEHPGRQTSFVAHTSHDETSSPHGSNYHQYYGTSAWHHPAAAGEGSHRDRQSGHPSDSTAPWWSVGPDANTGTDHRGVNSADPHSPHIALLGRDHSPMHSHSANYDALAGMSMIAQAQAGHAVMKMAQTTAAMGAMSQHSAGAEMASTGSHSATFEPHQQMFSVPHEARSSSSTPYPYNKRQRVDAAADYYHHPNMIGSSSATAGMHPGYHSTSFGGGASDGSFQSSAYEEPRFAEMDSREGSDETVGPHKKRRIPSPNISIRPAFLDQEVSLNDVDYEEEHRAMDIVGRNGSGLHKSKEKGSLATAPLSFLDPTRVAGQDKLTEISKSLLASISGETSKSSGAPHPLLQAFKHGPPTRSVPNLDGTEAVEAKNKLKGREKEGEREGENDAAADADKAKGRAKLGRKISDEDEMPRKQKLRFEADYYTPLWVRGSSTGKEGFCDLCDPGKWLQLKNSAFWYHKQFYHGISSISGNYFTAPVQIRMSEKEGGGTEGLCHQCGEWIVCTTKKQGESKTEGSKVPSLWYKHAHKCHVYVTKSKDGSGGARANKSQTQSSKKKESA